MKLSEMTTDRAADALVRIAEPAAEIVNDDNVWKIWEKMGKMKNPNIKAQIVFIVREVAPILLKDHRDALYVVLSIMTEKTVQQIADQKVKDTIRDIKESVDGELLSFFMPSEEQKQNIVTE